MHFLPMFRYSALEARRLVRMCCEKVQLVRKRLKKKNINDFFLSILYASNFNISGIYLKKVYIYARQNHRSEHSFFLFSLEPAIGRNVFRISAPGLQTLE